MQALRALAALYVVLYHSQVPLFFWSTEADAAWMSFQKRGFMGVDIFFVISGFIMAWVCVFSGRSSDGTIGFLVKRIFRVAPPYWLATLLAVFILGRINTSDELFASLAFIPLSKDGPPFYGTPVLFVGWSLVYEMSFYLIFAVALLFGRYSIIVAIFALVTLVFAIPLLFDADLTFSAYRLIDIKSSYLSALTNPMMMEFAIGMMVAWIYSKIHGKVNKLHALVVFFVGVITMAVIMATYADGHNALKLGVPAGLLLLGVILAEDVGLLKVPKFAVWLGDISFAIYLIHPVVIGLVNEHMPAPAAIGAFYGKVLFVIGAVVVISHHWYRLIEVPFQKMGSRLAKHGLIFEGVLMKNNSDLASRTI
ncbi:MAG: acyltransferase family protein [Comamonas sp.]